MRNYLLLTAVFIIILTPANVLADPPSINSALIVKVMPPWDTIDPGIAECVVDALSEAEASNKALIVMVDSYGGWLDSAFTIGDAIYTTHVPVIGYVAGGKALSAGTLILLPMHVVSLSRNSIIGAMQPVTYNPLTGAVEYVNESKVLNPIIQKALMYASARGRNESVVQEFIRSNLVLDSRKAVELGVADFEVSNLDELIAKLNGMIINTSSGNYIINIRSYTYFTCSLRSRALSILTNTLVSSILVTVGVMSLIFALASANLHAIPLALVFLILGLIGSGFNPNIASLLMILLGSLLLALELFVIPGFGVTGVSGIVLLVLGLILIPTSIPSTLILTPRQIEMLRITSIIVGVLFTSLTSFMLVKVIKAKKMRSRIFSLEGKVGKALDRLAPGTYGYVLVDGEYWLARSDEIVEPGELIYVVKQEERYLVVRKHGS